MGSSTPSLEGSYPDNIRLTPTDPEGELSILLEKSIVRMIFFPDT
jgi:hypothetical protein